MSDERPIESTGGVTKIVTNEDRAARKARFAQIVSRGFVTHRLNAVKLPPDKHGEWARNDPMEISRYNALGFEVADPKIYSDGGVAHGDGTKMVVGDVVYMVCSKEDHEIHQEIAKERFHQTYVKQPREGALLKANFEKIKSEGIQLQEDSSAAQLISNPRDI